MQEKAAAGTDSSAKGTRKPKNLDKNAEMEVTDAGSEVKDEGSMHEPTASSGADDDGGHAEIASASTAIHAPHVAAVASRP